MDTTKSFRKLQRALRKVRVFQNEPTTLVICGTPVDHLMMLERGYKPHHPEKITYWKEMKKRGMMSRQWEYWTRQQGQSFPEMDIMGKTVRHGK